MRGKSGWISIVAVACLAFAWMCFRGEPQPPALAPVPDAADASVQEDPSEALAAPDSGARSSVEVPEPATGSSAAPASPAFPRRPARAVGTLELRIHWKRDGAPARGIGGHLMPWGADDAFLMQRELRTDADGRCTVDQLGPGKVGIYLDRGGGGTAVIEAERVTTHDIALADGVTVTGAVLDAEGAPVPGAVVALSEHGNTGEGRGVATSDAAGRYEVRGITDQAAISARASGHAPSAQIHVEAAEGSVIDLDLHLRGPGGALRGVVLGTDGVALSGARVLIAPPERAREAEHEGRWIEPRSLPVELRTGEDGRFEATGLEPGTHAAHVRSAVAPPLTRPVEIAAGETTEVELRLVPGGGLAGLVRTAEGMPAAGATVYVGGYGNFDSHQAKVGSDGRYAFLALTTGSHRVSVSSRALGKAAGSVFIEEGATARWDATLVSGSSARGRVVDESGAPLAGWRVAAEGQRGLWHQNVATDADGRFVLENIPKAATTLAVGPPDVWTTGPALHLPGRLPTDEELLLVVPASTMPSASLAALLRGAGVEITAEATLSLNSFSPWTFRDLHPDAEGRIEADRIRPGAYTIRVTAPGAAPVELEAVIEPEEEHDLGELLLTPGGRLRVRARVKDVEPGSVDVQMHVLARKGRAVGFFGMAAGVGESEALAPGPYLLRARGAWRTWPDVHFDIEVGETRELLVDLQPGCARTIEMRVAEGAAFPKGYALRVLDASGAVYDERSMQSVYGDPVDRWRTGVSGLGLGRWAVVVEADDGRVGRVEIVVESLERVDGVVVVELR